MVFSDTHIEEEDEDEEEEHRIIYITLFCYYDTNVTNDTNGNGSNGV
jgi:hypothetical protein